MNKNEQKFSTRFRLWAKTNMPSCVIEIKHTRGLDKFRCRELKDHQYWSLKAARSRSGLAYKIPDDGMGSKPFDMIIMRKALAYVVIRFATDTVAIDIDDWDPAWKYLSYDKAVMVGSILPRK